jgi:hypothetical protein
MSFRLSSGIETKIDIHYKGQNGAPWREDVVGQLQLTSRSRDETEYYSVPAIDVVNGIGRAVIPAGMAYDPNGWRLRLTGTVDTEPRVIAYGVVTAVAGAGPQVDPQDVIDTINLSFDRGEEVSINVTLWADASKSAPYDLTAQGTTVAAYIFNMQGGNVLVPFAATVVDAQTVNLYLTPAQVNALPDACWWSLVATTAAGLTTLCEGSVSVLGVVSPPFTDVVANWNYTKQATLVAPISGQVIHCDNALDLLRIHQFDSDAFDRSPTLDALILGDTITVGVTAWAIQAIAKNGPDWYEAYIAPNVQASATGINPFTFHRP